MLRSTLRSWREYLTPVSHESTFRTTGEITPEEFVEAGDYLVYKFPTWQWSPAPESKRKEFLPPDKQFLVTRHVPSYIRCADYLEEDKAGDDVDEVVISGDEDDEGWTATHHQSYTRKHCTQTQERRHSAKYESMKEVEDDDEANNDIDELIDEDAEGDAGDMPTSIPKDVIINEPVDTKIRYYDLYVGYSTSYRVPKMYLVGFDYNGTPLTPDQMFEDIASDYRKKTATIEKAPFLSNTMSVSIHPCKHATVMKVLMNRAAKAAKAKNANTDITKGVAKLGLADSEEDGYGDEDWEDVEKDSEVVRVDQYLIVFLKFISSVTPGIEHDYTMDAF